MKMKKGDTMQKYIMVKATEEYRNEVRKMAHKHEMNISQFIRWLIDKQRKEDEKNGTYKRQNNL